MLGPCRHAPRPRRPRPAVTHAAQPGRRMISASSSAPREPVHRCGQVRVGVGRRGRRRPSTAQPVGPEPRERRPAGRRLGQLEADHPPAGADDARQLGEPPRRGRPGCASRSRWWRPRTRRRRRAARARRHAPTRPARALGPATSSISWRSRGRRRGRGWRRRRAARGQVACAAADVEHGIAGRHAARAHGDRAPAAVHPAAHDRFMRSYAGEMRSNISRTCSGGSVIGDPSQRRDQGDLDSGGRQRPGSRRSRPCRRRIRAGGRTPGIAGTTAAPARSQPQQVLEVDLRERRLARDEHEPAALLQLHARRPVDQVRLDAGGDVPTRRHRAWAHDHGVGVCSSPTRRARE